jgi:anti-sigma factor RsiW
MGCPEAQGLVQFLADGGLAASERAALEAHLAGCPACTAEAARLQQNSVFLRETLAPFRMPGDLPTEWLFQLPPRDAKRRAPAPAAPAAPRTTVFGETRSRGRGPVRWIVGAVVLGAAGVLGWLFLHEEEPVQRRASRPTVEAGERPEPGKGAADGRKIEPPKPVPPAPGGATAPAPTAPGQPMRTAADLAAALRAVRGDGWAPVVHRGWDLLAGSPAELAAAKDLAAKEKDPKVRAALALCLGALGSDESRAAAASFLGDDAAEVRAAAAAGLARALSFEAKDKRTVPLGPPLNVGVMVGTLAEDGLRAELAGRLQAEPEAAVRRTLASLLGPTAGSDPGIRDRMLDGVKGLYGDDLREACLRSLHGVKDASLVAAFAEALVQPGTPRALQKPLIEGMVDADAAAAAERLGGLMAQAEGVDLRKEILQGIARAGGEPAQRALLSILASDPESKVRLAAAGALQRFPAREVLDALQRAAEADLDQEVRQEAERAAKALKPQVEKPEGAGGAENPPADGN